MSYLVKHWFCVTSEGNWQVVKSMRTWGVPRKSGAGVIKKVEIGDKLVVYVKPKRIGGIFRAISKSFESDKKIFYWAEYGREEFFPLRVRLEPLIVADEPVNMNNLTSKLSFTKGKKRAGIAMRRSMFSISKGDFEQIRRFLDCHNRIRC